MNAVKIESARTLLRGGEPGAECRIARAPSQRSRRMGTFGALGLAVALVSACNPVAERVNAEIERDRAVAIRVIERELQRIRLSVDSIDAVLQPMPLLRPAEEAALRTYLSDRQLERARALGIAPGLDASQLDQLVATGELVRLEESSEYWIVRPLDYSTALLTPAAHAALVEIGRRFHDRLAALGLPPFRFEITSVLRSAEDQARLRATNPNAASGVSTHEFATTFDIAYSAFAPPRNPVVPVRPDSADWLAAHLQLYERQAAATLAARRSRELQAVLGQTLIELQSRGIVMVTLEQLQPVFHITVATADI